MPRRRVQHRTDEQLRVMAQRAMTLKQQTPELTWKIIAARLDVDREFLRRLIKRFGLEGTNEMEQISG